MRIERVGDRAQQERVSIGLGMCDASSADIGAGAHTVEHNNLLSKLL